MTHRTAPQCDRSVPSPPMGQLLVVRHGQASLMKADYDELSPAGEEQARALGRFWVEQALQLTAVFTGPARRQRDTARLAGEQLQAAKLPWPEPSVLPEFDEHDAFGLVREAVTKLRGQPEIDRLHQAVLATTEHHERSRSFQRLFEAVMTQWLSGSLELPEIETWPAFAARVRQGLTSITGAAERGSLVALFTSVGPLAVLLQQALATADRRSFETAWRIRNASLTRFIFGGDGRFSLDAFNTMPHLPNPSDWTFR